MISESANGDASAIQWATEKLMPLGQALLRDDPMLAAFDRMRDALSILTRAEIPPELREYAPPAGLDKTEIARMIGVAAQALSQTALDETVAALRDASASERAVLRKSAAARHGIPVRALDDLVEDDPDSGSARPSVEGDPPSAKRGDASLSLTNTIAAIMLDRERKDFSKRREVLAAVFSRFQVDGFFCRAIDGRAFYFRKSERRLYDLDSQDFEYLITREAGLGASEGAYTFLLHALKAHTAELAAMSIHTSAFFDPATGALAVSDAGAGVWLRARGGQWTRQHNGENGLLFFTEPDAESFDPDFNAAGARNLSWFLDQFLFSERGALSVEDQKTLLLIDVLHGLFPAFRRTRVLPAFLGAHGSGKTSAARLLGRLRVGGNFDVTLISREKQDGFTATLCNRTFAAIDNADSHVPWLEDSLAVYATGQRFHLRKLYSTNELSTFDPRATIVITSRDPHFRRADVAERLLPFFCERPAAFRAEDEIYSELARRRGAIWGELLNHAAAIADRIGELKAPPLPFRMADFSAFGWLVFKLRGEETRWVELLTRLEKTQAAFAADGDGLIEALRILLHAGAIGPMASGELFKECAAIAETEHLAFSKNAQGFGRRFSAQKRIIELELNCTVSETAGGGNRRLICIAPRAFGANGRDAGAPYSEARNESA